MTVTTSTARHLLVRFTQPARLPDAVLAALRDEVVLAGWMRASGVLSEVQLRVGTTGAPRHIPGVLHLIALEGSIGLVAGDVSCGLRAVLAHETESGIETLAGEIVDARIDALEVHVMAFDEVTATRELDAAGTWVMDVTESARTPAVTSPAPPHASSPGRSAPTGRGFGDVVRAAEAARPAVPASFTETPRRAPEPSRPSAPKPSSTFSSPMNQAMPQRIVRPVQEETEDDPVPEPGDIVEHFAFGRCEVVKSEGDRLHVRLTKDQRIKEIALEMLKVTPLPAEAGQTSHHWQLARKM